jgi:NAD(P)-dependent dehydrogenase (short-subunit alcohol dehydrogenase family)
MDAASILSVTQGQKPSMNSSLYCASKFALDGLVRSVREEVRPHGVKVGQVRRVRLHAGMEC